MKIRNSFVTNSSSSSFILKFNKKIETREELELILGSEVDCFSLDYIFNNIKNENRRVLFRNNLNVILCNFIKRKRKICASSIIQLEDAHKILHLLQAIDCINYGDKLYYIMVYADLSRKGENYWSDIFKDIAIYREDHFNEHVI